ncbi:MAG: two-component system sensor histidine kinase FlrB, partial [Paraglaciecola sp.]
FSYKLTSRLRDLESQVNDMLLFAKSGSEQVVVDLSMNALLGDVQVAAEAMVIRHDATLELVLLEADITILGNKTALCGAVQNLIHNALLAKPHNAKIILSARGDATRPDWLNLSVADNGPGIVADKLQAIFEPFYTTRSQGTGLGLAVVKTVAQSHHGEVSVQNLATGGACFTLNLPILKRQNTPAVTATKQPQSPLSHAQVARS